VILTHVSRFLRIVMHFIITFYCCCCFEYQAYEQSVRSQKIRLEMGQAKREVATYMARVEQAKAIDAMEERRQSKRKANGKEDQQPDVATYRKRRRFHQRDVVASSSGSAAAGSMLESIVSTNASHSK
jgi:hypothetical protein